MGKGFKKITMVFLGLGVGLLLFFHQPFPVWMTAVTSMTSLISILAIMQLYSIPIQLGNYHMAVQHWLTKSFKQEKTLFLFTTFVSHILASILSFGVIPVMVTLLGDTLKGKISHYERFISAAITRGFGLVVLWAPGAINVMLVIQATGVKWSDILLPSMVFSVIGMATSYFLEARSYLAVTADLNLGSGAEPQAEESSAVSKAVHVFAVVAGLLVFIILLEKNNFGYSAANRIMFAGAIVVLFWILFFVKRPGFTATLRNYWQKDLLKTVDLAPLFISMGIFSTALQSTGALMLIQPYLQTGANAIGIAALAVIPVLLILCAVVGIHPFISIVMFGHILTSLQLPIPAISIALCLALGGTISYIVSPFAGMILMLSKFINCRAVDISISWNGVFSAILFVEGIVFAYCWGRYFG
ncbi:MAG: putative rane protein [Firmicutes bacterium]|nr:putative rane protein [Bacillota bacterium]